MNMKETESAPLSANFLDTSGELAPKIIVFGVGGAGGNAVRNMIEMGLQGLDFIVANTDAQALQLSVAPKRIQLGVSVTQGLGAGAKPEIGAAAAEEALDEIIDALKGTHMLFITAGMGGGTGTGAAPIIARAARELGILVVGVVTKPFHFEGARRMRVAEDGILELQKFVDTLIIIPNQNLFRVVSEKTTFADAFKMADQVLHAGVSGITDLMTKPGLINLDFADVRTVMSEMGKAMMGTGEASAEDRAVKAAKEAISNPLLDSVSMKGARGVLINITGGMDMTLFEVDEAANCIREEIDPESNIIVGSTFDDTIGDKMRVSVVATGIDGDHLGGNYGATSTGSVGSSPQQRTQGLDFSVYGDGSGSSDGNDARTDESTYKNGRMQQMQQSFRRDGHPSRSMFDKNKDKTGDFLSRPMGDDFNRQSQFHFVRQNQSASSYEDGNRAFNRVDDKVVENITLQNSKRDNLQLSSSSSASANVANKNRKSIGSFLLRMFNRNASQTSSDTFLNGGVRRQQHSSSSGIISGEKKGAIDNAQCKLESRSQKITQQRSSWSPYDSDSGHQGQGTRDDRAAVIDKEASVNHLEHFVVYADPGGDVREDDNLPAFLKHSRDTKGK